jgi:hypothetical protein
MKGTRAFPTSAGPTEMGSVSTVLLADTGWPMKTCCMPHPLVVVDLEPDGDPPKPLVIGSNRAGNMLELNVLDLADERLLVIHATPLRSQFYELLPGEFDG